MRQQTIDLITEFCQNRSIDLINLRNIKKNNKTRVVLTLKCCTCGKRFDIGWDSLKAQEYPGKCTSCAHTKGQEYRVLKAQHIADYVASHGYVLVTPLDEIKPKGKAKTLNKAKIKIRDNAGYEFVTTYNNFHNRIEKFMETNDKVNVIETFRFYEEKIKDYLEYLNIPYKREFIFTDCRGKNGSVMRFDFCLYYTNPSCRKVIEVDERHHSNKEVERRDKTKNYYCKKHNIPILRIPYQCIKNSEKYKTMIDDFIK